VKFKAILFDLDGTLADTAPDLGAALNRLRGEHDLAPMPLEALRPYTSAGTRGMLRAGFNLTPEAPEYPALAERFLALYMKSLCVDTTVFPELHPFLDELSANAIPWGVVTNKPARYTNPLMEALELAHLAGCIISGDSAPRPKPAPDTLLMAASTIGIAANEIAYVGDDLRDILAGKAASMPTIAAGWGYLGIDTPIEHWEADWIAHHPQQLRAICEL